MLLTREEGRRMTDVCASHAMDDAQASNVLL